MSDTPDFGPEEPTFLGSGRQRQTRHFSSMVVTVANYLETDLRVPRITSIILDSIKRLL